MAEFNGPDVDSCYRCGREGPTAPGFDVCQQCVDHAAGEDPDEDGPTGCAQCGHGVGETDDDGLCARCGPVPWPEDATN